MKFKPKVLTIILIIFTLYLIFQTYNYYGDKQKTWNECQELSDKIVVVNPDNTETWEGWQNWTECNEEYINQFMMFNVMWIFSIIIIITTILSWRIDNLKKKG